MQIRHVHLDLCARGYAGKRVYHIGSERIEEERRCIRGFVGGEHCSMIKVGSV